MTQGRLETEEQFGNIIIRASSNGSFVRIKDVGRVELGAQTYSQTSSFNGKPAAVLAIYQLPGSNAVNAAKGVRELMGQLKQRFPSGLDYSISLDTTLAVTAGDGGNLQNFGGGDAASHPGRFRFPPRVASHPHSVVCRTGIADWHIRRVSTAWILSQYALAVGTRSGDRSGSRRRDRGSRSGRTPY